NCVIHYNYPVFDEASAGLQPFDHWLFLFLKQIISLHYLIQEDLLFICELGTRKNHLFVRSSFILKA
ncbi:hypothetical protein, partial [Vibrio vulnificus]|uniref:hypothetical protein n=1 Tax=Vibrio vulnificus TaxID=672 RepID=UPI000CA9D2D8